jgi:hypothetical protein
MALHFMHYGRFRSDQYQLLVYAIAAHKSRGITVSRAVLKTIDREFVSGLRHAAISCVEMLDGCLYFEEPFDHELFNPKSSSHDADTPLIW